MARRVGADVWQGLIRTSDRSTKNPCGDCCQPNRTPVSSSTAGSRLRVRDALEWPYMAAERVPGKRSRARGPVAVEEGVGQRLREERGRHDMSLRELARRLGVSPSAL